MSGPKRNPDKLNTIGVVVVGICGAVLVYVSIVALQAFYMNDTSEAQTMADYGGQDNAHTSLRATQTGTIEDCAPNQAQPGKEQTYRIPIKYAIKLVADEARSQPDNLVPSQGKSDKPTILPIFGRPKVAAPAATDGGDPKPTGGPGDSSGPPGQEPDPAGPPAGTGAAPAPTAPAPEPATDPAKPTAPAGNPAAPAQPQAGGTPAPAQPQAGGTPAPAQPKAGGTPAPAQPKAGATPAQPKAGAQPKPGSGAK